MDTKYTDATSFTSPVTRDRQFALITPSYWRDFERCKLLVESVEHCLTDASRHYLVVDRRDVPLFQPLTSSRTHLLVVEDLLPTWIFRAPGLKKWWLSLRTLPIRNWILQQLVKLSVCDAIDEDVLVFCDSDNTLLRPFDLSLRLMQDDRLALLRVNFQNRDVYEWTDSAKQILGLADRVIPPVTYVANLIAWHRTNVIALRQHIEALHSRHWIEVVCQHRNISEYMLYGIFVEHVLGLQAAQHVLTDTELIKPSWSYPLKDAVKLQEFFSTLDETHVGVMIHSKDDVPVEIYRDRIRAFWG
jgi:Family of unknown function (DUF6492)